MVIVVITGKNIHCQTGVVLAGSGRGYAGGCHLLCLFSVVAVILHLRLYLVFQQNSTAGKGAVGTDQLQIIAVCLCCRQKIFERLRNAGIDLQIKAGVVADELTLHIQLLGKRIFGTDQNGAPVLAAGISQGGAGRLRIRIRLRLRLRVRLGIGGWLRVGRWFGVGGLITLLSAGRIGLLTGIGIRSGVGLGGIAAYQCGNAPCNETQHQQDQ